MKDLSKIKVADIMSRWVVTVGINDTFEDVIRTLNEFKVHAVVVIGPGGEFMGVVSHSDIVEALKKFGPKIFDLEVEDIMCPKPYTIAGEASVKEAAAKMVNNKVHRLLVLSEQPAKRVPVGVVSATDIVRVVAEE